MISKTRRLIWLPLLFILIACRVFSPSNPTSTPIPVAKIATLQPSPTPLPTHTPTPTPTDTPTLTEVPPSLTPTQFLTDTPTPTVIPLNTQLSIFENIWGVVNDTYVYPDFNGIDWNAIHQEFQQRVQAGLSNDDFYLAMGEMISRLGDDHSVFLSPQAVAQEEADFQGQHDYAGIGILVSAVPERNRAVILSVFHNSPAEAAGLQPRDSLLSVDGTPILDENGFLRDIVRGPEGTTISIVVQTPGQEQREISITRHRITGEIPVVYTVITTPEGKRIGYILLVTFEDSTVDEQVADALRSMTADGPLDGLILDNRMNGGGSSTVLEPMLSYFAGGTLGHYINRSEQRPLQIQLDDINGSSRVPLVVLVGSGTASFGEIFSGVLQDIGRAYIIGITTDGNVEILWGYDFEDGSRLWLANETFRPLNHPDQNWEQTGIIPDLTVSGEFDEYTLDNDPTVIAAIQYLSGR